MTVLSLRRRVARLRWVARPRRRTALPRHLDPARRRAPKHHFASVIDCCHNIAEHMAYTEEKGNYSSQKFPRKPEFPR